MRQAISFASFQSNLRFQVSSKKAFHQHSDIGSRRVKILCMVSEENKHDDVSDQMRKMLEASWNSDLMGDVPSDAERAAYAVYESLQKHSRDFSRTGVKLVNILLPQYDISQGTNLYDEVLAVDFCRAFARRIGGKTAILVRDGNCLRNVKRVFDAREVHDVSFGYENERDNPEIDNLSDEVAFYDDFAEFQNLGSIATEESPDTDKTFETPSQPQTQFRLASMLGDTELTSRGPDLFDTVISAMSKNGKPRDDEETIVVLSPASVEEAIAVRALINSYRSKKSIILVNCKLEPLPRELSQAEVVYSLLPLVARASETDNNLFTKMKNGDILEPKVVVLRRYPSDWEIFVDIGNGFELAATAPVEKVGRLGPETSWIAGVVKEFLQTRA